MAERTHPVPYGVKNYGGIIMDTKWLQENFDKGKMEVLKFAKNSKIKIEINSLKKSKDERIRIIGQKVLNMIENGELDSNPFEPDYTYINDINEEIEEKEAMIAAAPEEEAEAEETGEEEIELVTIESQKVITADSIPVEPENEAKDKEEPKAEEEKKDELK